MIGFCIGIVIVGLVFEVQERIFVKKADEAFKEDVHYQYYYSKLDEEDQFNYRRLYYTLKNHKEKVTIHEDDIEKAEELYYAVMDDHPEFYYLKSTFEYIDGDEITIWPAYQYSQEEIEKYDLEIENKTQEILNQFNEKEGIEKIEAIYDYIIENTSYHSNNNDQNILSVLLDNQSVCAGYARCYQYLLNQVGIDAAYVGGISEEDADVGHAWVMIHYNNDYYYSDPTWGDIEDEDVKHSCKAYFMMNSEQMLKHYSPDSFYEKTMGDYNYFDSIGCYMREYDRDIVSNAVKYSLNQGNHTVEIQCASQTVYNRLVSEIKGNHLAYYVLKENDCYSEDCSYSADETNLLIEIYY